MSEYLKNSNKEKGSVTLYVLIVCMFFIGILLLIDIGLINNKTNKEKELNQILANYSQSDNDLNNVYPDSYVLMNDSLSKPYISYDSFDFETLKPNIDVLKVVKKHENDESVNPHTINPNYLKLTEAEEKLKNHD